MPDNRQLDAAPASRGRIPDSEGFAVRDGVRLAFKVYGNGEPTLVLMPTWQIIHSRFRKAQVGFLARHFRVVTFDARGSGRSGRPVGASAYANEEIAADTVAVMDATGTDRAVLVSLSCGAIWSVHVAANHPDRVLGLFTISPSCGFPIAHPDRTNVSWEARPEADRGWALYNRHHWLQGGYDDFVEFFFSRMFTEPHSSKQIEDCVGWAHEIDPATLVDATAGRLGRDGVACIPLEQLCPRVRCPVTVVDGTDDRVRPYAMGVRLAELTGASLVLLDGVGHGPPTREPVQVNRLIKEFVDRVHPPAPSRARWTAAQESAAACAVPVLADRARPRPARPGHRR